MQPRFVWTMEKITRLVVFVVSQRRWLTTLLLKNCMSRLMLTTQRPVFNHVTEADSRWSIDMYIDWIAHLYHWQLKPELRHVLRPAAMFDGPTSRSEDYRFVL